MEQYIDLCGTGHNPQHRKRIVRTQVVILGGGPAGTLLALLLHASGIESVVLERRSRQYVLARIRAGVIEQTTADILRSCGLALRMEKEGQVHEGVYLSNRGRSFRVDFRALTGGAVTVYGQTELQRDLYEAVDAAGIVLIDEVEEVAIHAVDTVRPFVTYCTRGRRMEIQADFIAGCDGAHGVSRTAIPANRMQTYERVYPFAWLGVMTETPPVNDELIYARSDHGFALCSMRHAMLSRYYVQCPIDTLVSEWPDERLWQELRLRIPADAGERLVMGPSIEKSVTALRSSVSEPMSFGRLFIAGDAAHVVPPTGAKGLNLAVSDVVYLSRALIAHYKDQNEELMEAYSEVALRRVWKATRFSWWLTTVMHTFSEEGSFTERLQDAELEYLEVSERAQGAMAENYIGLPY